MKRQFLKAVIIRTDDNPGLDMYAQIKIACAEAKKDLKTHQELVPIDWIRRPYGQIVVLTLAHPGFDVKGNPGVRRRKG